MGAKWANERNNKYSVCFYADYYIPGVRTNKKKWEITHKLLSSTVEPNTFINAILSIIGKKKFISFGFSASMQKRKKRRAHNFPDVSNFLVSSFLFLLFSLAFHHYNAIIINYVMHSELCNRNDGTAKKKIRLSTADEQQKKDSLHATLICNFDAMLQIYCAHRVNERTNDFVQQNVWITTETNKRPTQHESVSEYNERKNCCCFFPPLLWLS